MKTRVFNLIILDESGSMYSIKKATVSSVNETIQSIRQAQKNHEDQEHYVTFVTFNDTVRTVLDCIAANEVKEIADSDYQPNCCTALYDAMGMSLTSLRPKVADEDKVLVTIVTDGLENASKEYTNNSIKMMVDELKGKGWVFVYVGANHKVEEVASSISINNTMTFNATSEGVCEMSVGLKNSRERWYNRLSGKNYNATDENSHFFDEDKD